MRHRPLRLLLDTHIWVWYVAGSKDLPSTLRDALDDAPGSCWLSPISMWELGVLLSKARVRLNKDYRAWIQEALTTFPIREAPGNFEVAQLVRSLELPHSDPADQLLTATALVYDLTLVTVDRHLVSAAWLPSLTA